MIGVSWREKFDALTAAEAARRKVWGKTTALLETPFVAFHRIEVQPGMCCSRHKHERKWNAFLVIEGELRIEVGDGLDRKVTLLRPGALMSVPPGEWHRFFTGSARTVAIEAYYPAELSEDIIRRDVGGSCGER